MVVASSGTIGGAAGGAGGGAAPGGNGGGRDGGGEGGGMAGGGDGGGATGGSGDGSVVQTIPPSGVLEPADAEYHVLPLCTKHPCGHWLPGSYAERQM